MPVRKINYHEHDAPEMGKYPDISDVVSANECTGLMYRPPKDRDEEKAYKELSSMQIPKEKD